MADIKKQLLYFKTFLDKFEKFFVNLFRCHFRGKCRGHQFGCFIMFDTQPRMKNFMKNNMFQTIFLG